ncbi:uncharacterized protein LOC143857058 [Tasmannia lanceolata]|uniref:uncharacterized protein LOC143857058 n=1 Tax=Tasmannia lanceolata TaxID=3420 RepID=UPI004062B7B6
MYAPVDPTFDLARFTSYDETADSMEFLKTYRRVTPRRRPANALIALRQSKEETLRSFMSRFNAQVVQITNLDLDIVITTFKFATHNRDLKLSLHVEPPRTLQDLMTRADRFVDAEESLELDKNADAHKPQDKPKEENRQANRPNRPPRPDDKDRNQGPVSSFEKFYTPLTTTVSNILNEIGDQGLIHRPKKIKTTSKNWKSLKYCHYHEDRGHTIDECFHLKEEIERLVTGGQLHRFARHLLNNDHPRPSHRDSDRVREVANFGSHRQIAGNIDIISGGPAARGPTTAGRNTYLTRVNSLEAPTKNLKPDGDGIDQVITFTEANYKGMMVPHDDAVVICLVVANSNVSKILVDIGSSLNILHCKAFDQMGNGVDRLTPFEWDVYGFSGDSVKIGGQIDLPVTFGTDKCQRTLIQTFLVVQVPSTYNAIIGRPALNELQAVVSTPHLKMKFLTPHGIEVICGDQN